MPAAEDASSRTQQSSVASSSPSKKRTIDLSASDDDDDEADAKRLRPNFLNEAEQTLLLAQLNGPQSSSNSQETKGRGGKAKAEQRTEDGEVASATEVKDEESVDSTDAPESATNGSGKTGKKTPIKKNKKKASSVKEGADSFFSPDPKQSTSRKATPDSSKKRNKASKSRAEPSPGKSIKELIVGPPKPKPPGEVILKLLGIGHDSYPEEQYSDKFTAVFLIMLIGLQLR